MTFKIGDRVRINASFDILKKWGGSRSLSENELARQQAEHPGFGHVEGFTGPPLEDTWVWVRFEDGYYQNYPQWALVGGEDRRMPEPEMDLVEIEKAQEVFNDLQGRRYRQG